MYVAFDQCCKIGGTHENYSQEAIANYSIIDSYAKHNAITLLTDIL